MYSCIDASCRNCLKPGIEIKIVPCNCSFHASCFPLYHLFEMSQSNFNKLCCPSCNAPDMKGVLIVPIDTGEARDAFEVTLGSQAKEKDPETEWTPFDEFYLALAPIFLFESAEQTNYTNNEIAEDVEIRNGRWTSAEVEFIECLINAFKDGNLLVSNGKTLNNFLRSIFLCKSTRLRKKMKNAKFCTSTYCIQNNQDQQARAVELIALQEKFLDSLDDDNKKVLLRFSLSRMWKTHFFNLCMEIGYDSIIAQEWLDSSEQIEDRVRSAKESKKTRDRRSRVADIATSNRTRDTYSMDKSNHSTGALAAVKIKEENEFSVQHDILGPMGHSNHSHHDLLSPMEHSNHVHSLSNQMDHSNHSHGFSKLNLETPAFAVKSAFEPKRNSNIAIAPQMMFNHSYSDHPMAMLSHTDHAQANPNCELNPFQQRSGGKKKSVSCNSFPTSSLQGKDFLKPPELVPTEIKDSKICTGNVSDMESDSESLCNTFVDGSSLDLPIDEVPSAKRARNESFDNLLVFDADPVSEQVEPDNLLDLSDVCDKFGDWSPFVKRIAHVIESENLPFEYFDVWVASSDDGASYNEQKKDDSGTILRHVGHSARSTGSIWTLYHMHEFGKRSSKFKFRPGVGLPGRVYSSGQPLWDDSIQNLSRQQFPRVEFARAHGIKKALGIPVFHSSLGKIVVALYSSDDVVKDEEIVQKCCNLFETSNIFNPKWEHGVKKACKIARSAPNRVNLNVIDHEEQKVANMLAKCAHLNMEKGHLSERLSFAQTSLRLLLLRPPSRRTPEQNSSIDLIKSSYQNYLKANRNEQDIVALLIREWSFLGNAQQHNSSNIAMMMSSSYQGNQGPMSVSGHPNSAVGASSMDFSTHSVSLLHTNYCRSPPL